MKIFFIAFLVFCSSYNLFSMEFDSPFGVNFWEKELNASSIKWARINIRWEQVEKEKGEFDFSDVDKYVNELLKSDIKILAVLVSPPQWARKVPKNYKPIESGAHAGWGDFPPNDLDAWGKYVFETVNHFKDRIKYWEIWNEPHFELFFHGGTPDDYVALLKVAYTQAKKVDPHCKIVGLGGADYLYAKIIFEKGGFDFMDIVSIHIYHPFGEMPERGWYISHIQEAKKVVSEYGEKDIWITETGWPTHIGMADNWIGVKVEEQAKYLVRSIVLSLSLGIKKIFWFMSHDSGDDIKNFEHNQGLLYHDKTPKPSYFAYTTLIKMLDGFISCEKINVPPFYIYLFKKENKSCFVLWTISPKMKMKISEKIDNIFDIQGKKIEMVDFYLPISPSPIYILTDEVDKIKNILINAEIIRK